MNARTEEIITQYENIAIFDSGVQILTDLTVIDIRLDSLLKVINHILSDLKIGRNRNQFKYNQFVRILKTTSQSIRSQNILNIEDVEFICKILDDTKLQFYLVEIGTPLQQMTEVRDELEKNLNCFRDKYGTRPVEN
jgi:hypothetical protein